MSRSYLSRETSLFTVRLSLAMMILLIAVAMLPFAFRGAKMALQEMRNDVRDWLPQDFTETTELDWFRQQFLGEQFVLASWPGCTGDDPRLKLLVQKLLPDNLHQRHQDVVAEPGTVDPAKPQKFVGDVLGLHLTTEQVPTERTYVEVGSNMFGRRVERQVQATKTVVDLHENWAGADEKWLKGHGNLWYFILPTGELHRWGKISPLPIAAWYELTRFLGGDVRLPDEPVADLPTRYYENPRLLEAQLFKTVTTGPMVLDQLAGVDGVLTPPNTTKDDVEVLARTRQEAIERLEGALYGPDGEQTCVVVTLTDAGRRDLNLVVGRGLMGKERGRLLIYAEQSGVRPEELRLGGPPVDNVAIDEEGSITLVRLVGLSIAVGLSLAILFFRSVAVTIMVFFVGGVAAVSSLAIVWWGGGQLDAILMSMPSLVYVLGLSGAVHIINYYRDSVSEHGVEGAAESAFLHGWWPCTLAAFTTSIGLLSLLTSELTPIKKFGGYSAAGVMFTLAILFTVLPAALHVWPPRRKAEERQARNSLILRIIHGFWDGVCTVIVRYNLLVVPICFLVMVGLGLGLLSINTEVQLIKLFANDAKILQDHQWMEENLGALVPMEIVVRLDKSWLAPVEDEEPPADISPQPLDFLERMEAAARVHEVIEREFGEQGRGVVGSVLSAKTFAPELPEAEAFETGDFIRRRTFAKKLWEHRGDLLASDFLRVDKDDQAELWRISLRMGAFNDIDYGVYVNEFKQAIEPIVSAYRVREELIEELDEQGRHVSADVLVLGLPYHQYEQAPGQAETRPAADQVDPDAPINADRIFGTTLRDLIRSSRMEHDFHHPDFQPLSEGLATSPEWGEFLSSADAVVLAGDHSQYDLDFIRRHAPLLIDARDHEYHPDPNAEPAAAIGGVEGLSDIRVIYTGIVPIVYKAQATLLKNLLESIGWAFVLIAVVMMVLLRNVVGGLVSMIPNVFPVVVVFGAMGLLHIPVDIGSMMTASVAMGVAVDDTIHFLTWFRRGLQRGMSREDAIRQAFRRCSMAMTQTTFIGGLGLAVFWFSTFTPTKLFGILMLALLVAALVGDLLFLPALLASPLGRVFRPKEAPEEELVKEPSST